jgi:tetratricopeptide (TPR) repeat protein
MLKYLGVLGFCFCLFLSVSTTSKAQNVKLVDSLSKVLQKTTDEAIRIELLNRLAFENYYAYPMRALQFALQASQLAQQSQNWQGEAEAYRQVGLANWAQGNLAIALKYFLQGLKIAEKHNLKQSEADILGNLGLVYFGMKNYKSAKSYQLKALAAQIALKNRTREAVALNNLADVYAQAKDFAQARQKYQTSLQILQNLNNWQGVATNLRNMGQLLVLEGNLDEALAHFRQALAIADSLKDRKAIAMAHQDIAQMYWVNKQPTMAEQEAQKSLQIAQQAGLKSLLAQIYALLANLAQDQRKPSEALNYYRKHIAYRDSTQSIEIATEIIAQQIAYETEKKQLEILLLKNKNMLQKNSIRQKNYFLGAILAVIVLLMGLVWTMRKNYLAQSQHYQLLFQKNQEIECQKNEILQQKANLEALNEEITQQQEEVAAQRDTLLQKNLEIEENNFYIKSLNENLEKIVLERTEKLKLQNEQLAEYAFLNAHKLRSPLASIMGLVNLIKDTSLNTEQDGLINHLSESAEKLDKVIRNINHSLENGLELYNLE